MTATMSISLPDELREFVECEVREGAFPSTSAFVQQLIRDHRAARQLRELLIEGERSGPGYVIDLADPSEYWVGYESRRAARLG